MRTSKLLGILLLIAGVFVFTRGTGWHFAYMAMGSFLGFVGLLLLSRRPTRRMVVKAPRSPIAARPGRVRVAPHAVSSSQPAFRP